ncbi:MAG: hypothetical protein WCT18_02785 [Patescibacteria group bacterium]
MNKEKNDAKSQSPDLKPMIRSLNSLKKSFYKNVLTHEQESRLERPTFLTLSFANFLIIAKLENIFRKLEQRDNQQTWDLRTIRQINQLFHEYIVLTNCFLFDLEKYIEELLPERKELFLQMIEYFHRRSQTEPTVLITKEKLHDEETILQFFPKGLSNPESKTVKKKCLIFGHGETDRWCKGFTFLYFRNPSFHTYRLFYAIPKAKSKKRIKQNIFNWECFDFFAKENFWPKVP